MSYQEAELRSGKSGQFWVREEIGVAGENPRSNHRREPTNHSRRLIILGVSITNVQGILGGGTFAVSKIFILL